MSGPKKHDKKLIFRIKPGDDIRIKALAKRLGYPSYSAAIRAGLKTLDELNIKAKPQ